jgi:hypothetical protein
LQAHRKPRAIYAGCIALRLKEAAFLKRACLAVLAFRDLKITACV